MCVTPLFLVSLGWQKAVDRGAACEECALTAAIYTYPSVRVSLFSVTSFAGGLLFYRQHLVMPPLAKWLPGPRPRLQNHYSPAVFF